MFDTGSTSVGSALNTCHIMLGSDPISSLPSPRATTFSKEYNKKRSNMESILQNTVFGLHIDDKFDYDRHVRDHPFIIPRPVQSGDLFILDMDIGNRLVNEEPVAWEEILTVQTAFIAWYQQFQAQFEALMRNFAQRDLPDDALRKIIEYLEKVKPFPYILGELDGYVLIFECWCEWDEYPTSVIEAYELIADWVLNLPFPDIPWESREEERKDRASLWSRIKRLLPGPMSEDTVREQERALVEKPKALDAAQNLVEQLSMMSLK